MPTESTNEKPLEKEQKTVPLDTSGPGAEVIVSDEKDESVVETKDTEPTVTYTEPEKTEPETKEEETVKEAIILALIISGLVFALVKK